MKILVGLAGTCALAAIATAVYTQTELTDLNTEIDSKVEERVMTLVDGSKVLQDRITELEQTNLELQSEIEHLKEALKERAQQQAQDQAAAEEEETIETEVASESVKIISTPEAAVTPQALEQMFAYKFKEQMEAYVAEQEAQAEAEREVRRQEEQKRRDERDQERVVQLAEELGLNDQQVEQLLVARASMRDTISEMFRFAREQQGTVVREDVRDAMTEVREQHLATVGEFMTQEQYDAYVEQEGNRGPFGFSGGGGRGGPGGGRGGGGRGR